MYCKGCGCKLSDQSTFCVKCKAELFDLMRARRAQAVPPITSEAPAVETPVVQAPASEAPASEAPAAEMPAAEAEEDTLAPLAKGECGNAFAIVCDIPATPTAESAAPILEENAEGESAATVLTEVAPPAEMPATVIADAPAEGVGKKGKKTPKPLMRGFGKALASAIMVEFSVVYAATALVCFLYAFVFEKLLTATEMIPTLNATAIYSGVIGLGLAVPTLIFALKSIRVFRCAKAEGSKPLPYPALGMGIYSLVGSITAFVLCLAALAVVGAPFMVG